MWYCSDLATEKKKKKKIRGPKNASRARRGDMNTKQKRKKYTRGTRSVSRAPLVIVVQCGEVVVTWGLHIRVVQKKYRNLEKKAHTVVSSLLYPLLLVFEPCIARLELRRSSSVVTAWCVVDVGRVAVVVVMVIVVVEVVVLNRERVNVENKQSHVILSLKWTYYLEEFYAKLRLPNTIHCATSGFPFSFWLAPKDLFFYSPPPFLLAPY